MNLGWLLKLYFLDDRFVIILFSIFKLGFMRTKSKGFRGLSIVIGISKLELQINLSLTQDIQIKIAEHETGKA